MRLQYCSSLQLSLIMQPDHELQPAAAAAGPSAGPGSCSWAQTAAAQAGPTGQLGHAAVTQLPQLAGSTGSTGSTESTGSDSAEAEAG